MKTKNLIIAVSLICLATAVLFSTFAVISRPSVRSYRPPITIKENDFAIENTWVKCTAAGSKYWKSIASSANGNYLVAIEARGYTYISRNSGKIWEQIISLGAKHWSSIAISNTGVNIAVCTYYGEVYTSNDGGRTWGKRIIGIEDGRYNTQWDTISLSDYGRFLAVAENFGYMYISNDYGETWTQCTNLGKDWWNSIDICNYTSLGNSSMSANIVACTYSGKVYIGYMYTDNAYPYFIIESAGIEKHQWKSITTSSDGNNIAVCSYDGSIFTSSDGGTAWTNRSIPYTWPNHYWESIASSLTGENLVICDHSNYVGSDQKGHIYVSNNYGETWEEQTVAGRKTWTAVAISSRGQRKIFACDGSPGFIYTHTLPDSTQ